jgi:hypothetical protein
MPRSRATLLLPLLALLALAPAARADRVAGTPYVVTTPDGAVYRSALKDTIAGLRLIDAYERHHVGLVLTAPTEVRLVPGTTCGDDGPVQEPGLAGVARGNLICIFTEGPYAASRHDDRRFVAAHEAVHVLQSQLGCTTVTTEAPTWYLEGMAELFAFRALLPATWTEARLRTSLEAGTKLIGLSPGGLRPHERSDRGLDYSEAARAVIALDGGAPSVLLGFCRAVGRGVAWPTAFASSFGETVNHFYTRFARIRAHIETLDVAG